MTEHRLVVHPDGRAEEVAISNDELSELRAAGDDAKARVAARAQHDTTRDAAAPSGTVLGKLRSGAQLTAPEQAAVIRWLALQVIGPEQP